MAKAKTDKGPKRAGGMRLSQVVSSGGPGALIDFVHDSVLVGALDDWAGERRVITEPFLLDKVRKRPGLSAVTLEEPPAKDDSAGAPAGEGVQAWRFPEWFVTTRPDPSAPEPGWRRMFYRPELVKGEVRPDEGKPMRVVPVRFVRATWAGHIADLDWVGFVHKGGDAPPGTRLWLQETGTSGDLARIYVRSDTGDSRRLSEAQSSEGGHPVLGWTDGECLWLGRGAREPKADLDQLAPEQRMFRLLVRSATNAWFPVVLSAISIPDVGVRLREALQIIKENVEEPPDCEADIRALKKANKRLRELLVDFSDLEVLAAYRAQSGAASAPGRSIKGVEFQAFQKAPLEAPGEAPPKGPGGADFFARAVPLRADRSPVMQRIERVVLVHRLREVRALVGFTRFDAISPDLEGELDADVRIASLAREPRWVPAVENHGEGVFIGLSQEHIRRWIERETAAGEKPVLRRQESLLAAFKRWKADHKQSKDSFPGVQYVMLHSLAHLLVTAVSLECGYAATSIRERIYSGSDGTGILLYTATPDSEGTLGGLVGVGRNIERTLRLALESARLCSNDPVCATHAPDDALDRRFLHGASCHGCLLIGETSCERRNEYLDRSLVVPTLAGGDTAFFGEVMG